MKLKFVTHGISFRLTKHNIYVEYPTTAVLGTFKPVNFEDLKTYVKKFEKVWVEL